MTEMKIYLYKMTADTGGAPCVANGLLSLAICKPKIRQRASKGDLIFGFAAKSMARDNRLIYAARVTKKLSGGTYYKTKRFAGRSDCIYDWRAGRFNWKSGSLHHGPRHLTHDIGDHPDYRRADVLLSSDFRYFGKDGRDAYKARFPEVHQAILRLARGHRVHHSGPLRQDLLRMKGWLWKTRKKVQGRPTSSPSRRVCHRNSLCAELS
jgi:hypothetical protein